jgi:hypothetical protein
MYRNHLNCTRPIRPTPATLLKVHTRLSVHSVKSPQFAPSGKILVARLSASSECDLTEALGAASEVVNRVGVGQDSGFGPPGYVTFEYRRFETHSEYQNVALAD